MAEIKMGRTARLEDGFLSDDDPLAELAHIVGYAPRTAPQQPAAPASPPVRREPEFDLEEELMREFERFDSPVVLPSYRQSPPPAVPPRPVSEPAQPVFGPARIAAPELPMDRPRQAVDMPAASARVEPKIAIQPDFDASSHVANDTQDEPVLALADDALLAEFGIEEPSFAGAPFPDIPDFGGETDVQPEAVAEATEELNLADELDMSRSAFEPELPQPVKPAAPVSAFAEWKTERLEGAPIVRSAEPVMDPFDFNWDLQPQRAAPEKAKFAPVAKAASADTAVMPPTPPDAVKRTDYGLDDLMAELERYPVATMPRSNPVLATPVSKPAAAPVAEKPPLFEPVREAPVPERKRAVDPVVPPAAVDPLVAVDAGVAVNPFDESEFELDLDSIALEIADTHPDINWKPSPQKAPDIALHFDPEQIADIAEVPEYVADLHVPNLPVIEKEKPAVVHPDHYIENEVHDLFGVPPQPRAVVDEVHDDILHWGEDHYRPAAKDEEERINAQLEDFERELEEDFRRSLSDAPTDYFAVHANAARRVDRPVKRARQHPSRLHSRGWLLAASVGVIAILAGGGLYAWMEAGSSSVAGSSEPRVILADKEPMKVVPENKGGTTVPNQDKAVYDQVAGTAQPDPKQQALVSTSEEPVDVIQKTLIPESVSLDTRNESAGTLTEDTTDGRLLPGVKEEAAADAGNANTAQPTGVAPRKVKTMVVKPDGTLVAREDTPSDAVVPVAGTTAATAQAPVDVADNGAALVPSGEQAPAAASDTPATGVAPPAETTSQQDSIADAANAQVDIVAPVRKVKTTVVAPVPTSRPADQPVNVVGTVTDKGNVRPKNSTAPVTAPVEVAAATPANAPVVEKVAETAGNAAPAAASGSYVMQVASLPSEEDAKRSYANLTKKFGSVLSGKSVDIRRAEIAGKGTFYRVRIVAGSKADAVALCEQYRAVGGSCIVSR